jgi:hypothetical protein
MLNNLPVLCDLKRNLSSMLSHLAFRENKEVTGEMRPTKDTQNAALQQGRFR